jgi:hypothetical protein
MRTRPHTSPRPRGPLAHIAGSGSPLPPDPEPYLVGPRAVAGPCTNFPPHQLPARPGTGRRAMAASRSAPAA